MRVLTPVVGDIERVARSDVRPSVLTSDANLGRMSTADQTHSARLHGEALLAARSDDFRPVLEQLAEATDRPDVRGEVAGRLAAEWFADPESGDPRQLIAAGLLLTSGIVDYDRLGEVVREVAGGSLQGYDPTDATG